MQLSPPATAALHTESFYVQVPAVLHREPNPQRALTASGRWRRDTINRLSPPSFFIRVMSMWMVSHLYYLVKLYTHKHVMPKKESMENDQVDFYLFMFVEIHLSKFITCKNPKQAKRTAQDSSVLI